MSEDLFRPSEYTAALLRQLRLGGPCTGRVLEMGTGSGVVLCALAAAGARELVGVDVEPEAVRLTQALLRAQGATRASVRCGDLWQPLAGEQFDLVVFNPPQLPLRDEAEDGPRPRSWSRGGRDGREILDRFLGELGAHLAPQARALITHSSFLELETTQRLLAARALRAQVMQTVCVQIPPYKLRAIPAPWLESRLGRSLHCVGPYVFTDFHVVEIRHAGAAQAC
jgi:release factor glutamine methyltransferase